MRTQEEWQKLYDDLGSMRAVARHIGMSTAKICKYLKEQGVVSRKRGGDWKRMRSATRRLHNEYIPVEIKECYEPHLAFNKYLPTPYPCIKHNMMDNACEYCKQRIHATTGASSGWTTEQICPPK